MVTFDNATHTLSIVLDELFEDNSETSQFYEQYSRFGLSFEPFGVVVAEKLNLQRVLADITDPAQIQAVKISVTKPDVGISTSFLRGLLRRVMDVSPFENWKDKFSVEVTGRYERSTGMAVNDFRNAEMISILQDNRSSEETFTASA